MIYSEKPACLSDPKWRRSARQIIYACALFTTLFSRLSAEEASREMLACLNPDLDPNVELAACNRALESGQAKSPHDIAFVHHGRALAYMNKRDFTHSLAEFNEAIRIQPGNSAHFQNRGSLYDYMGDFARAMADYDKAISLDPGRAGPYFDRGLAREHHGDRDGAIKDYQQALRIDPNYIKPQEGLSRLNWSGVVIATKQGQGIVLPVDRQHPPQKSGPATEGGPEFNEAIAAGRRGDYSTAFRLLKPLAERGVASAQDTLGGMYYYGQGMPRDYAEAVKWYRQAADRGNPSGQFNLGNMYHDGKGVAQNYNEAVRLYALSAKQGYAPAQSNLGNCYALGRGVKQDDVLAYMWFDLAAKNGVPQAIIGRDGLASKLSASQIAEAERLGREHAPKSDSGRSSAAPLDKSPGVHRNVETRTSGPTRHSHRKDKIEISP